MADVVAKGSACACGQRLPWHLFDVGVTDHVCSCECYYKNGPDGVVIAGTKPNPFARYDAAAKREN